MSINEELELTLDDAVQEVLGQLTGMDLVYDSDFDRYRAITRQLNKALRLNALEKEWSYYSDVVQLGAPGPGEIEVSLPLSMRTRIVSDDAVRLVDEHGHVAAWAYYLPRDALHKYRQNRGLWVSVTRSTLTFNRPLATWESNLVLHVPVMREPLMFRLPATPSDPDEDLTEVPEEIRLQPIDFAYPDVITMRAAMLYAMTDPVMQPRVQTLEAQYKDLMYQIIERDDRNTDSPLMNTFVVPVRNGIHQEPSQLTHWHPHADSGHGGW